MKIFSFIGSIILLFSCAKVKYVRHDETIENMKMQPSEALQIAEPYLKEHATYVWRDENSLRTHIIRKGKYYYVMRTDYPAKTTSYYMQPAVKINSKNGKFIFTKR